MEYRGGTYIEQVKATSESEAVRTWVHKIDRSSIHGLGMRRKAHLVAAIENDLADGERPAPLTGLKNAWCKSAVFSGEFVLINIVATAVPTARRIGIHSAKLKRHG
jgi:hypothetical protein